MTYTAPERLGAHIALAALKRDTATMTGLLLAADDENMRHAAAVALAALAELAIKGRPSNLTRARDTLRRVAAPEAPPRGPKGGVAGSQGALQSLRTARLAATVLTFPAPRDDGEGTNIPLGA